MQKIIHLKRGLDSTYEHTDIYIYKSFKLNELALSATNPQDIKAILENKIVAEEEIGT